MSDPRTKLDVIFHDLLGEVGEVLDRQASLQVSLDRTAEDVASRIELQTRKLDGTLDRIGPELVKHMTAAIEAQLEATKRQIAAVAKVSVEAAAKETVLKELTQGAIQMKSSTDLLERTVQVASKALEQASAEMARRTLLLAFAASVSAALASAITVALLLTTNVR